MPPLRRLASGLLHTALRYAPAETEEWARAMLSELDFIEGDWAALFWALGSATAIFRHSGRAGIRRFIDRMGNKGGEMNQTGKNAVGVAAGIGIGLAIAVAVISLWMLSRSYFPGFDAGRVPWRTWLLTIGVPEIVFIGFAVRLWRKRRPMAIGILLIAIMAGAHFAMHLAQHWRG